MEEIWKDILGFEGLYQVSNLGRVKSLPKEWFSGKNTYKKHNGKILKPCVNKIGYYVVNLTKDKKSNVKTLHQLVAMAFLNHTPCGYKLVVDHINNNKLDNRLENLQLITHRENTSKDKKNCTSKYTGVSWCKELNKWRAGIRFKGKSMCLGYFNCELKAFLCYQNKLKQVI